MNRLQEILERKQEIRTLLQSDQEVDVKEIEKELRDLQDEEQKIIEKRKLAEGIQLGQVEHRTLDKPPAGRENKPELRDLKWDAAIETTEYRSAWAKDMMGLKLNEEERSFMDRVNDEYRDFTHSTENTQVLIPKTVADGIWRRAEEESSLWTDVRKLRVKGELSMKRSNGNSADGRWYDEDEVVETDQLGFGELNLTGCELAKAIEVTWKLRKMAVSEFESYIQEEIGLRMGSALGKAVYEGRGKPGVGDTFKAEPLGIKTALMDETDTPQYIGYTDSPVYTDLTSAMGKLHSSYANGSTIYASSTTIWNTLANLRDGNDRPYFIPDVTAGGVGRIFGRIVKPDAAIPEGEILIGNLSAGYVANINEDITMYREEHVRARKTDYMGYAIVDGGPRDNKAFVILGVQTPEV
ncbi:phage major capsid protein [Bacillus sp. AG4(2022)]|uniref:phage major capsid protein n=1 Tax=Bacillus sp. AG4(2022) TaxID=2962594 RepID=UPI0028825ABB|nr:phage major capsid protein [Bacillus sp. AG4(2022)]MDT0163825.1 phage major capsid protein [Bacillus sp. AG4(2022)]